MKSNQKKDKKKMNTKIEVIKVTDITRLPFLCLVCKQVNGNFDCQRIWLSDRPNAYCIHINCLKGNSDEI